MSPFIVKKMYIRRLLLSIHNYFGFVSNYIPQVNGDGDVNKNVYLCKVD